MRVRIVRQPEGNVSGIELDQYLPGQVYDVTSTLGTYLVAGGWAEVEMRDRGTPPPRAPDKDRRRKLR